MGWLEYRENIWSQKQESWQVKSNECAKISSENGICSHEDAGSADIIIVGAGVAGSALACTLGKVEVEGFYFLHMFEFEHIDILCA